MFTVMNIVMQMSSYSNMHTQQKFMDSVLSSRRLCTPPPPNHPHSRAKSLLCT